MISPCMRVPHAWRYCYCTAAIQPAWRSAHPAFLLGPLEAAMTIEPRGEELAGCYPKQTLSAEAFLFSSHGPAIVSNSNSSTQYEFRYPHTCQFACIPIRLPAAKVPGEKTLSDIQSLAQVIEGRGPLRVRPDRSKNVIALLIQVQATLTKYKTGESVPYRTWARCASIVIGHNQRMR